MFFILNAIIIFFSSITSSSFITLLFSISIYISGQTIEEVVIYLKSGAGMETQLASVNQKIIEIGQYVLPNLSVFDLKVQAAHAIPISFSYVAGISVYAFIYSAVLLLAACLIFSKRELA